MNTAAFARGLTAPTRQGKGASKVPPPRPSLTQSCPWCPGAGGTGRERGHRGGQQGTERQQGWRRRGNGDGDRRQRHEGDEGMHV